MLAPPPPPPPPPCNCARRETGRREAALVELDHLLRLDDRESFLAHLKALTRAALEKHVVKKPSPGPRIFEEPRKSKPIPKTLPPDPAARLRDVRAMRTTLRRPLTADQQTALRRVFDRARHTTFDDGAHAPALALALEHDLAAQVACGDRAIRRAASALANLKFCTWEAFLDTVLREMTAAAADE